MLKFNLRYFTSVLFLFIFLICTTANAQIEFFKEDLQFELNKNFFTVAGDYYFRNIGDHDIKATLFYPIPRDSLLGYYDSVKVTYSSQQTDSPITIRKENGFFFNVEINSKTSAKYSVSYRQKLLGNKAKYIFTTTNTWGKPLECANFRLSFPKNIRIDSISIIPDSLMEIDEVYTVFWTRENFMPGKDFVILFHEEEVKDISQIEFRDKNTFLYARITPLLIPGIAAGYVIRHNKLGGGLIDYIITVNFHYYSGYQESYGLSLVTEYFKDWRAKGFFYRLNVGLEYGDFFEFLEEGGPQKMKFLPNITGGIGYSFSYDNSSSVRISVEIGWTSFLGRINVEYFF